MLVALLEYVCGSFIINSLWIPLPHLIPALRTMVLLVAGTMACTEQYQDLSTWHTLQRRHSPVEGRYRWLAHGIVVMEVLLIYKFRHNAGGLVEDRETPALTVLGWLGSIHFLVGYYLYLRLKRGHTTKFLTPQGAMKKAQ